MEPKFRRAVYDDFWVSIQSGGLSKPVPVRRAVLGFRFEASERELSLIRRYKMFSHVGLRLHENLDSFTLAELIGPEFIPEVSSSWDVLLPIEVHVRAAAAKWTHLLESMA